MNIILATLPFISFGSFGIHLPAIASAQLPITYHSNQQYEAFPLFEMKIVHAAPFDSVQLVLVMRILPNLHTLLMGIVRVAADEVNRRNGSGNGSRARTMTLAMAKRAATSVISSWCILLLTFLLCLSLSQLLLLLQRE